jgi:hypothetical protein
MRSAASTAGRTRRRSLPARGGFVRESFFRSKPGACAVDRSARCCPCRHVTPSLLFRKPKVACKVCNRRGSVRRSRGLPMSRGVPSGLPHRDITLDRWSGEAWHGLCFYSAIGGLTRPVALHNETRTSAAMRIYDIEFDIDSSLDEMEEMQRARRQRQQQIHRSADVVGGINEGPRDRDAD